MRKRFAVLLVISLLSILTALPSIVRAEGEQPPDIEKGWNLISTPCDVSISEIKQKLGNDEIKVFDWNGAEYLQVETLERGRGYMLNANAVLNTSSVCKDEAPLPEGFSKTFRAGWNLIGNPYHQSVIFEDILGNAATQIGQQIYEYQGNKIRQVALSDNMKVWRGYWIYTRKEITLDFETGQVQQPACDSISVIFSNPATPADGFFVGDEIALEALCSIGGETKDITNSADWLVDFPEILNPTDAPGKYLATSPGNAIVNASYMENIGALSVTIKSKPVEDKLLKITVNTFKNKLAVGEKTPAFALGDYSDGSVRDITPTAEFTLSDTTVGEILTEMVAPPCMNPETDPSGNPIGCGPEMKAVSFRALSPGKTQLKAKMGDIVSETYEIEVVAGEHLDSVLLVPDSRTLEPHQTSVIFAYAVYAPSGRYENATQLVEWIIEPPDAAAIEPATGRLTPLKIGTFQVSAKLDGIVSNMAPFTVTPKSLRWMGIFGIDGVMQLPCPSDPRYKYCYNNLGMKLGSDGRLVVVAEYSDSSTRWLTPESVKWEVSNPQILTVSTDGKATPVAEGFSGIRAYMDGVYSEWAWVYVYTDQTKNFLLLEYSNEETIVEKGKSINIGATYYSKNSDTGRISANNVTGSAEWTLGKPQTGSMAEGNFTGSNAGDTTVTAKFNGLTSNSATLRVWQPEHLTYCDPAKINEQTWQDGLSIASLEADCANYSREDTINVRFLAQLAPTVTRRVLDVCLDLYIYDSNQNLVRTFQNRNCSPSPLFRTIVGATPVYDYSAAWDQKDDTGNTVPPGEYTAVARYYVLYCPVLKVKINIQ